MNLVRKEIAFLPPFSKNECSSPFLYVFIYISSYNKGSTTWVALQRSKQRIHCIAVKHSRVFVLFYD